MKAPKLIVITGTSKSAREALQAYLSAFPDAKIVEEQPVIWRKLSKFVRMRYRKSGIFGVIDALALRLLAAFREKPISNIDTPSPHLVVSSVNDPEVLSFVSAYKPDVIVLNICSLLSASQIEALNIPIVNVHNGITPRYRGSGNIWALAEDNPDMVGVTLHRVDAGIDTGERLSIEKFDPIAENISFDDVDLEAFRRGAQLAIAYISRGERSIPSEAVSTVDRYYAYPGLTTWLMARRRFAKKVRMTAPSQSIERIWQTSFSELAKDESRTIPQRLHWSEDRSVLWRDSAIREIVVANSPSDAKLLDVGCGDGRLSELLTLQYFGCDFSESSINLSKRNLRQVCALASALPFQSQSFDVCVAVGLFQHLDRAQSVADEMLRVVASNGLIVINTLRQFSKFELVLIVLGSLLNRQRLQLALAIWRRKYGPHLDGNLVARRYKISEISEMFPRASIINSITYHGAFGFRFLSREFTLAIRTPDR